ncbi:S-adenosyl-L-methionine-dependent methyltransferase [Colletotrichum acutatum]|uniref:S-adenosyl-L-methionine-dependent methyltransferase n=1 Tax=Glomerella acutata TaxID=27357 RepID=A0AAD8UXK3_GLOAC|nr:S-adenosyl-L-methionine-dependent methyltransferase [Colletotrichum acutatum]KAK1728335.1 S-adenosyl-L-methionine-dependent methyltransferase [Colletotrichum acutatum]
MNSKDEKEGASEDGSRTKLTAASFLGRIQDVTSSSFGSEDERMQVLLGTYALMTRLESPWETLVRICMTQPALGATLKILKDLQLFEKWQARNGEQMTSCQLAELLGGTCDPALLYRFLRLMASNHLLEETSVGVFRPTSFGVAITAPIFDSLIHSFNDTILPMYAKMPEYFSKTNYINPQDSSNTVFQYAQRWDGNLWSYYQAHPKQQEQFNVIQQTISGLHPPWTELFPAETLTEGDDPQVPLLVDIGGSTGHDVLKLHSIYPETASRLYLEDLESVVEQAVLPEGVNKVPYDFFTAQPIKDATGAKAYLMHSILHDWSDAPARKILEMQKEAMTPGFSRLLIHDNIFETALAHPQTTAFDIQMMAMVAGQERTEDQWRELINSAGLHVVRIWRLKSAVHSVIEVLR